MSAYSETFWLSVTALIIALYASANGYHYSALAPAAVAVYGSYRGYRKWEP